MVLEEQEELDMRDSGIDCIGRIPWGMHFCQFYMDTQGLLDLLVPYFEAGLAGNEYCLWITAAPLSVAKAREALANTVTDLDRYLAAGQIEIVDSRQWYTPGGRFEADRVLQGWVDRLDAARLRGYAGLRLSGDTRWLEASDWPHFVTHEGALDHLIGSLPMLALCTYSLDQCGAAEILDVVSNHAFALIERAGYWQVIHSEARKKDATPLRQSEARYRVALQNTLLTVATLDAQLRYTWVYHTRHSLEPEIVLGKRADELLPPADVAEVIAFQQEVLAKGVGLRRELHGWAHGETWVYDATAEPIFDAKGTVVGLTYAVTDITIRQRTEEALHASEENLRAILDTVPESIYLFAVDNTVLALNTTAASRLGRLPCEVVGHDFLDFVHPDIVESRKAHLRDMVETGQAVRFEDERDGLIFDHYYYPVFDGAQVKRIAAFSQDITERKHTEEALSRIAVELIRSNEELQLFAYVASHDLLEPLRAVSGYISLLNEHLSGQLDAKAVQYINGALEGATRMQQLINDLLALSRVGTHKKAFAPTNLNAVLALVMQSLSVSVREAGATITHDPLPTLNVDAGQIAQLFQNLLANAIKFHNRPPEIHISVHAQAREWVFAVRDNGIGIAPQYFARIFLIFQRLHTRKQYPGTGIGLAICKKIIERHGGTIHVESQPGEGSTFYFTLPSKGTP